MENCKICDMELDPEEALTLGDEGPYCLTCYEQILEERGE
jgi:hypothetical protein